MPLSDSATAGLLGGAMIGAGSLLAFVAARKIPGISGVVAHTLRPTRGDLLWRVVMLAGLVGGAGLAFAFVPGASDFGELAGRSPAVLVVAGLLVGFGTRVGGGCTSGHGVCGIGRGLRDSMIATVVFMAAAVLMVWIFNQFFAPASP